MTNVLQSDRTMGDHKRLDRSRESAFPKRLDLPMGKVNAHLLPSPFTKSFESVKKKNLFVRSPSPRSLDRPGRRRRNRGSHPRFSLSFRVDHWAIVAVRGRDRSLCSCRHLVAVFSDINAVLGGHLRMQHCSLDTVNDVTVNRPPGDAILWIPSSGIFVVRPCFLLLHSHYFVADANAPSDDQLEHKNTRYTK
jgi:hypothetical protein